MNMDEKLIQPEEMPPEVPKRKPKQKKIDPKKRTTYIKGALFAVFLIAALLLIYFGSDIRSRHISDAYIAARDAEAESVYQRFYDTAFEQAEERYHVSNRAVISIGDVTRLTRLEVLTVSDSEFVIENESDNDQKITSWLEVQGIGVFTVDLQAAEFITDAQRQYVLVRVWKPELTNCTISSTGDHFWKNGIWNDSIKVGVELSREQMREGRQLVEDSIRRNRNFYDSALSAAESSIRSLVKSWNPDIPDLTVEIEFIDPS